jgi:hypothetical protein
MHSAVLPEIPVVRQLRSVVADFWVSGVSTLTKEQSDLIGALKFKKLTKKEQLSLDL